MDLVERTETLEVELAATLIYWASHHPYRQVRDMVARFPKPASNEIIELGLRHRGKHDEALRAFHAGAALRFDILMDIGGFRDMHRHRRVTQIKQGFTALHGYETPLRRPRPDVEPSPRPACWPTTRPPSKPPTPPARKSPPAPHPKPPQSALYLLPLATRIRCLFKMDFAEAQYISELRSGPAGHFSYRRVAWEMYSGPPAPASRPGPTHPRHRLHPAHRPPPAVVLFHKFAHKYRAILSLFWRVFLEPNGVEE